MRLPSPSRCRVLVVLATAIALTAPGLASAGAALATPTTHARGDSQAGRSGLQGRAASTSAFGSNPATVGPIPDSPDSACDSAAAPGIRDVSIPVTGVSNPITSVSVQISMRHSSAGDLAIALIAPNGAVVNLADRTGKTPELPCGESSGIGNVSQGTDALITFSDTGTRSLNTVLGPLSDGGYVTGGTYFPATRAGVKVPMTAPFAGLGAAASGYWTLRFIDYRGTSTGTVSSAVLRLTTLPRSETAACKAANKLVARAGYAFNTAKRKLNAHKRSLRKAQRAHRVTVVRQQKKAVARGKVKKASTAAAYTAAQATYQQNCS